MGSSRLAKRARHSANQVRHASSMLLPEPAVSAASAQSEDGQNNGTSDGAQPKGMIQCRQQKSLLLSLPPELRRKIWAYSIQHDAVIKPRQVQYMSNKFTHGAVKVERINGRGRWRGMPIGDERYVSIEPPLTVVSLSLVCHQIYAEVAGAGLFYKIHHFEFRNMDTMLNYLVAITPARLNHLRSVIVHLNGDVSTHHASTILATCESLESVKIYLDEECLGYSWYLDGILRFRVLRGLKYFQISLESVKSAFRPMIVIESRMRMSHQLKELRQAVSSPRGQPTVSITEIRAAQQHAKLNIHGGGRLGLDKKPGIVASRTRGQLQKQKSFNNLGVVEDTAPPKYNKFGELLWYISSVSDSRMSVDVDGLPTVELYIKWLGDENGESWEDCNNVISPYTVFDILHLYHRNPAQCGFGIVSTTALQRLKGESSYKRLVREVNTIKKRAEGIERAKAELATVMQNAVGNTQQSQQEQVGKRGQKTGKK